MSANTEEAAERARQVALAGLAQLAIGAEDLGQIAGRVRRVQDHGKVPPLLRHQTDIPHLTGLYGIWQGAYRPSEAVCNGGIARTAPESPLTEGRSLY
jgi:hypothetical protein